MSLISAGSISLDSTFKAGGPWPYISVNLSLWARSVRMTVFAQFKKARSIYRGFAQLKKARSIHLGFYKWKTIDHNK